MNISKISFKNIYKNIAIGVSLCLLVAACNSNDNGDSDVEIAVTYSNVAVSAFALKANSSVLANLDSVYFAIDLEHGVIFNADSLPKGTDVSHLLADITFASTLTQADLTFYKENRVDTTVNYLENATDSIDFTHPVTLDVTAADGTSTYSYIIKVNVHQIDPDTLIWDKLESAALPARFKNPVAQKTIEFNKEIYCLVEEYNGEFTLSKAEITQEAKWTTTPINFTFDANIDSFSPTTDALYIMDTEGYLYSSENGFDWMETGEQWFSVIGGYGDILLGLKKEGDSYYHTSYPIQESAGYNGEAMAGFPVSGRSSLHVIETEWTNDRVVFFAGGVTDDGQPSPYIWGFDGNNWETLNETTLPDIISPSLFHYVVYKDTPVPFKQKAFDAWMLMGGHDSEDGINKELYVSLDNGVNWTRASTYMKLPEEIPAFYGADILVIDSQMSFDLNELWSQVSTSSLRTRGWESYTIDGFNINWQCPYIYIFGGYNADNELSESIWRGILAKLTFTPII